MLPAELPATSFFVFFGVWLLVGDTVFGEPLLLFLFVFFLTALAGFLFLLVSLHSLSFLYENDLSVCSTLFLSEPNFRHDWNLVHGVHVNFGFGSVVASSSSSSLKLADSNPFLHSGSFSSIFFLMTFCRDCAVVFPPLELKFCVIFASSSTCCRRLVYLALDPLHLLKM